MLTVINEQVAAMQSVMSTNFEQHPAAQIYLSQPGLGPVLAARVLGEFGDDPTRFASSEHARTIPGKARSPGRPGTKRWSWPVRARGTSHHAALRQVANRLVDILHGCLADGTLYDEAMAWNTPAVTTQNTPMALAA